MGHGTWHRSLQQSGSKNRSFNVSYPSPYLNLSGNVSPPLTYWQVEWSQLTWVLDDLCWRCELRVATAPISILMPVAIKKWVDELNELGRVRWRRFGGARLNLLSVVHSSCIISNFSCQVTVNLFLWCVRCLVVLFCEINFLTNVISDDYNWA